ncbi:MAG: tetratricopeptide repeat protein [Phycisphaera sp.]|nr:MAG: tetratricopeptide repeat protein [Phycisphaera sp.]
MSSSSSPSALDMVIGSGGDSALAGRLLGEAREQAAAGDRLDAIGTLRKAVQADAGHDEAAFQLAYHLDLAGEEDEAISLYERLCDKTPAPVNALLNLAVLYEDRQEYNRAERCLRQVLDTDPNHPRARLYMKDVVASRDEGTIEDSESDHIKRRQEMEMAVTDFDLSVRTRTALKRMNIRTLGDLLRTTEAELMSYKNFGDSSLDEIKKMLSGKNMALGQGVDDGHRSGRRTALDRFRGTSQEAMLNKPVTDLALSVRARRALQLLNIQSLGDLVSHTEAELMGVKNFGATSLTEVKERLVEIGMGLRTIEE